MEPFITVLSHYKIKVSLTTQSKYRAISAHEYVSHVISLILYYQNILCLKYTSDRRWDSSVSIGTSLWTG
jgi:hypothetical protein